MAKQMCPGNPQAESKNNNCFSWLAPQQLVFSSILHLSMAVLLSHYGQQLLIDHECSCFHHSSKFREDISCLEWSSAYWSLSSFPRSVRLFSCIWICKNPWDFICKQPFWQMPPQLPEQNVFSIAPFEMCIDSLDLPFFSSYSLQFFSQRMDHKWPPNFWSTEQPPLTMQFSGERTLGRNCNESSFILTGVSINIWYTVQAESVRKGELWMPPPFSAFSICEGIVVDIGKCGLLSRQSERVGRHCFCFPGVDKEPCPFKPKT